MQTVDYMLVRLEQWWDNFTFFDEKFFFVLAIFGAVALVQGLKTKKN